MIHDSDLLPFSTIHRAAKAKAPMLGQLMGTNAQHAIGCLVSFWDLCGDPRDIEKLVMAGVREVWLTSEELVRRWRLVSGAIIDPEALVVLGFAEQSPGDDRYRVRGMSRYFEPVEKRLAFREEQSRKGKASAAKRLAATGSAQPSSAPRTDPEPPSNRRRTEMLSGSTYDPFDDNFSDKSTGLEPPSNRTTTEPEPPSNRTRTGSEPGSNRARTPPNLEERGEAFKAEPPKILPSSSSSASSGGAGGKRLRRLPVAEKRPRQRSQEAAAEKPTRVRIAKAVPYDPTAAEAPAPPPPEKPPDPDTPAPNIEGYQRVWNRLVAGTPLLPWERISPAQRKKLPGLRQTCPPAEWAATVRRLSRNRYLRGEENSRKPAVGITWVFANLAKLDDYEATMREPEAEPEPPPVPCALCGSETGGMAEVVEGLRACHEGGCFRRAQRAWQAGELDYANAAEWVETQRRSPVRAVPS